MGAPKPQQTNPAQAAQAFNAATGAGAQAQQLGQTYSQQAQDVYKMLFGNMAGGRSSGGTLSGMLDPTSLNVSAPTGPYALQYTKGKEAVGQQYQNAQAAVNRMLANRGFGATSPSGLQADESRKLLRDMSNQTGQAFTEATGKSYQDALQNFWNATDLAGKTMGGATQAGLQGTGQAADTYRNLYGTAGAGHMPSGPSTLQSLISAGGSVGAAAAQCCATGTLVRTVENGVEAIEKLAEGIELLGLPDQPPVRVIRPLLHAEKLCVQVRTSGGEELVCSTDHTLLLAGGGYVRASESLHRHVRTPQGAVQVLEVLEVGLRRVVRLQVDPPHIYETNGLLSEE